MFNLKPTIFALLMSFIDAIALSGLKDYNLGKIKGIAMIVFSMLIYSLKPLIFLKSLSFESMTVMNILWDVSSDIIVSLIGLFYFKEQISIHKKIGLFFAFIAILLFSYEPK
jgi:drug/metabolite transporter (DMT)-like permease